VAANSRFFSSGAATICDAAVGEAARA